MNQNKFPVKLMAISVCALCVMAMPLLVFADASATYMLGDVNGDQVINNKDYGLLQRFINLWEVEIDRLAADVNRDGKINNKDLGILKRHLNGWDTELGEPIPLPTTTTTTATTTTTTTTTTQKPTTTTTLPEWSPFV